MKLQKLYETIVALGMKSDPRGLDVVKEELSRLKKEYEGLDKEKKQDFDTERFNNPYSDTRVLYGNADKNIKSMVVGVDIDTAELLLADRLRQKGERIDLVMSHHPNGRALAELHDVMYMQADILNIMGVPINVAEGLLSQRAKEVERRLAGINFAKAVDAARILDIAFMCAHTACDNFAASYLQKIMDKEKPLRLSDIIKRLKEIPEYKNAVSSNAGPKIIVGNPNGKAGKIFIDMTGGTEGSKDVFAKLSNAGVGTVIGMHFSEDHIKKAKVEHVNIIVAGHIASDNLGINLMFDSLLKEEKFEIIPCSGFVRVKR